MHIIYEVIWTPSFSFEHSKGFSSSTWLKSTSMWLQRICGKVVKGENTSDFISFQTLHILSLKRQFYNCNCYVSCNIDVTYICQLANKTVTKWHGWVIVLDLFLGINIQVTIVFPFLSLKLGFRRIQLLLCLQLRKTPLIQCVCVCVCVQPWSGQKYHILKRVNGVPIIRCVTGNLATIFSRFDIWGEIRHSWAHGPTYPSPLMARFLANKSIAHAGQNTFDI